MSTYEASLRMLGENGPGLPVVVDLRDDRLEIRAGDIEIGDWSRDEVRINADVDGIHLRAEGEEVVLDLTRDAEFAVEVGLRQAPPLLRRRMAQLLRSE
ncbi:MAG: hypothetical protein ACLGHX_12590 [Acidimicrobiia bacterium]